MSNKGQFFIFTFMLLWTALSLALGVEVKGELIRGLPCITRFNQLFCRSGGTSYPTDKIAQFIDDNKALIRRMHGEFLSSSLFSESIQIGRKKRSVNANGAQDENEFLSDPKSGFEESLLHVEDFEGNFLLQNASREAGNSNPYVNVIRRKKRQARRTNRPSSPGPLPNSARERIDVCKSDEEVATPYWASNSQGKIVAIVNNKQFSQIIHQEICTQKTTVRCKDDCGCEQKYKYHRLMAYDPDNECKGIFMDWFLFPSCCSCRCDPL